MMKSLSLFTERSPEKGSNISSGVTRFAAILNKKELEEVKRRKITKPHQFFGVWIAQNLGDFEHLSIYIKLAKEQDRALLENAVSYVKDYPEARSRYKLFMWYLKGKMKKVAKKPGVKARQKKFL